MDLTNKNIVHIKDKDIEYIQFKRLLEYKDVLNHSFILKSEKFDYKKLGNERYNYICEKFGLENKDIIRISQTHSANVEIVNEDSRDKIYENTDGIITNNKNIVLPIQVADCISLILFDPNKMVVANIHSGWRGTVKKIAEVAIKKMVEKFNCNTYDIICSVCPSIGKCHFEVGKDVKDIFEQTFKDMSNEDIILESKTLNEKYFIDTVLINRIMLRDSGLKDSNIIESNICTVCNSEKLHSYRVAKDMAGRNLSIVNLK